MYYDEYTIGQRFECPTVSLSLEEIKNFAKQYDPLPIHLDETFVKTTRFNSIIASGFHTLIATWSQWAKSEYWNEQVIAGISIDECLWKKPVYADDVLSPVITILDKIDTKNEKQGILVTQMVVTNQNKDVVLEVTCKALIERW